MISNNSISLEPYISKGAQPKLTKKMCIRDRLYGLFIASILIVPLWLGSSIVNGIIDAIFGKRR